MKYDPINNNVQLYNQKIKNMLLNNQRRAINKEKSEFPLPIFSSSLEPSFSTPTSHLTNDNNLIGGGFKFKIPKVIERLGEKAITKLSDKVIDKGVNYIDQKLSGSGLRRRPKKTIIKEEIIKISKSKSRGRPKKISGGKFNFINSMKNIGHDIEKIGKPIINKVGNAIINKGIDKIGSMLTNPAVEEGAIEAAPMMLAAGIKSKRAPTKYNLLVKEVMKKYNIKKLSDATKFIKHHNLKY